MTAPREWLLDLVDAAEDLGYGIVELAPARIVLLSLRGDRTTITVESILLNGDLLRRVLRDARAEPERVE